MIEYITVFSSFSVNDETAAEDFYSNILGLQVTKSKHGGLDVQLDGGGKLFIYPKEDHQPGTFTVLNFAVKDVEQAVDELAGKGVQFEHYDTFGTDEKGIAHDGKFGGPAAMAWFKDPAGNILALVQD